MQQNSVLMVVLGIMGVATIAAFTAIIIAFPDNLALAGGVAGALVLIVGAFITPLFALKQSAANAESIEKVHSIVNSNNTTQIETIKGLRDEVASLKQLIAVADAVKVDSARVTRPIEVKP